MKVIAITGSPGKFGNSYKIVKRIEERLKEIGPDQEFDYLFLRDCHLELCQGCSLCLSHGEDRCPLKDDRIDRLAVIRFTSSTWFIAPVLSRPQSPPPESRRIEWGFDLKMKVISITIIMIISA